MPFTPLTPEQYQKALDSGFTPEQVIQFEKKRQAEENATASKPEATSFLGKAADFGLGFLKSAGRSVVDLVKGAQSNAPTLVGVGGLGGRGIGFTPPAIQTPPQLQAANTAQTLGGYAETAAEVLAPTLASKEFIGKTLIQKAQALYTSALKPSTALSEAERSRMVQTGLREGITVSERGMEKLNTLVDSFETKLTSAIDTAAGKGGKIATDSLKAFIDEAKRVFGNLTDVQASAKYTSEIDAIYENFVKKYGPEVDVKTAQTLKTSTYQWLKGAYGELSSAVKEANKQMARGLKEGIIKESPIVGDINKRLGDLYNFADQLERSTNRIANKDVVSLGGKVLLAGAKGPFSSLAALVDYASGPAGKSNLARLMNTLGQQLSPEEMSQFSKLLERATGYMPKGAAGIGGITTGSNIKSGVSDSLGQ